MEITKRKLRQAVELCELIAKNGLKKPDPNKPNDFIVILAQGSHLGYAAKRFAEKNESRVTKINRAIHDKGCDLALKDKETDEILLRENGTFRMTPENQKIYDNWTDDLLNEKIALSDEDLHICKEANLPKTGVPFELEFLNGLILQHDFWPSDAEDAPKQEAATGNTEDLPQ